MVTMTRSSFRKQLQEGLNTIFGMAYERYTEEWRDGFEVERSGKAYEEEVLMVGLGPALIKAEGDAVSYDAGHEGWVSRYTHEVVALGFQLTEEAMEDNLYGELGPKFTKALARSMVHTKEVKGADVYNNAFSSSYLGGDNVALCSTAHPLAAGGTLANKFSVAADLSEAALEEALQAIADWTDDRLIPVAHQVTKMLIPTELQFVATRLLMSDYRPGVGDNDVNALKRLGSVKGGFAVNHRFTDPDAWFLRTDCPDGMKHFVRRPIRTKMEGDFESGNMRYKTDERYSFGWSDWRGVFGTEGA